MKVEKEFDVRVKVRLVRTTTVNARVSFSRDPDDYGNGFHMAIRSDAEPFGMQAYDIRYDTEFAIETAIEYIVKFYAERYDGCTRNYEMVGISVEEVE